MAATVATPADAAAVSDTLARAFYDDPTWSWAFADPERRLEQQRAWWGLFVGSAIPHECVWMTEGCGAAAIFIPPGVPELNEEDEARSEVLLRELIGDRADEVLELQAEFAANHPSEPHYYLSLLGTHPEHRGKGLGMQLVADNLESVSYTHLTLPTILRV